MKGPGRSLEVRLEPAQARAQETVEALLDTAARLLEEVGLEGFNTNLLAARAGVRVRTVYRYFPNKHAVITQLATRAMTQWNSWFGELTRLVDPAVSLESVWSRLIDAYVQGMRRMPGARALRRAMRADDQLRGLDDQDNAQLAHRVSEVLRHRWPCADGASLRAASRVLLESASSVIDVALGCSRAKAAAMLAALKAMHATYLRDLEVRAR